MLLVDHLLKTTNQTKTLCFPKRLEYIFSVTIFYLPRRFQNVFKTSSRHLPEGILKTCPEDVSRCLGIHKVLRRLH